MLIIMRGLPGSGKSTYAKKWVEEDSENRARVNRDDLRTMMHDGLFLSPSGPGHPGTEHIIRAARDTLIEALLGQGIHVVCDDTNLDIKDVQALQRLARKKGAENYVHDLRDVPLDVCLDRNAQRVGRARVPDEVIIGMHAMHCPPRE